MALSPAFKNTFNRYRRNPVTIAVLLTIVLAIWLISGDLLRAKSEAPESAPVQKEESSFQVETDVLRAERHAPLQIVQGQLEPLRAVEIRSQISAHVTERPAQWGMRVKSGDLLFELDPESRAAELARADAELQLSQAELRAGEALFQKDLLSETEFLRLKAEAASANAERKLSALQLQYTNVAAPFDGLIDRLPVEAGDYVQVGESLATLVDVSTLRLIAYIPQQQVQALHPGLDVEASLLDGTKLSGTLIFVASLAESSTRSFRVEARIDNPELRRIAGASVTLSIRLPEQQAHRLSPALLVLGESGQLGVRAVNAEQRVEFLPVNILSFDTEGVWVGALPDEAELITLGAGFVVEGDLVSPADRASSESKNSPERIDSPERTKNPERTESTDSSTEQP